MSQSFDLNRDHFALFGLAPRFALDAAALDKSYRQIQSQVHPDRFAHLSDAERRASMQWATHVNGAYQTLKSPLTRARYLIERAGVTIDVEKAGALPAEFLREQMEWREAVEAARGGSDAAALRSLERDAGAATRKLHARLEHALDIAHDPQTAKATLFNLMFLDKLREEIGNALEAIETA